MNPPDKPHSLDNIDSLLVSRLSEDLLEETFYGKNSYKANKYFHQSNTKLKQFVNNLVIDPFEIDIVDLKQETLILLNRYIKCHESQLEKYKSLNDIMARVISVIARVAKPFILHNCNVKDKHLFESAISHIRKLVSFQWKLVGNKKTHMSIDTLVGYFPELNVNYHHDLVIEKKERFYDDYNNDDYGYMDDYKPSTKDTTKYEIAQSKTSRNDDQELNVETKSSDVEKLLDSIYNRCNEIFFDQFHVLHVSIKVNDHFEIIPFNGIRLENIILKEYFDIHKTLLSKEKLSNILNLVKAQSELDTHKQTKELNLRVAKIVSDTTGDICYYYDLVNSQWQIIKVTSEGWDILSVNENPIFTRYRNNHSQVLPNKNYSKEVIERFLDLINVKDKKNRLLLLVYIVTLFIPTISKPMLILRGSKGVAKTTTFELIKKVVDPSDVDTFFFPKEVNDLIQMMSHNYVTYFDNISFISYTLSDMLCRAVTGTGFSKRKLYSDDEDISYNFKRAIGLNGINLASVRPDFLDRSIIVDLERITKENRRKEGEIKSMFKQLLPDILGWIFDVLVKVLKFKKENAEGIILKDHPRMAEFAEDGEIVARCIGYNENEFINTYFENIQTQNEEVIESSVVAKIIMSFMEDKAQWEGPATELYSILTSFGEYNNDRSMRSKSWPNAANALSRKINELASTLRDEGIDVAHKYDNKRKSRIIYLTNIEKISSLSSYRSSEHESDKAISEPDISNFINSENVERERESESNEKGMRTDIKIPEAQKNDENDINKVINIHQIAGRIHERSDIWKCKTCDHKGDKWDLLNHYPNCRNNKK